jgi:hypothetical protein
MSSQALSQPMNLTKRAFEFPEYAQPVSFLDRIFNDFFSFGSRHDWSCPYSHKSRVYPAGYNSHQICLATGTERFFDRDTWEAGPEYHYRPNYNRA